MALSHRTFTCTPCNLEFTDLVEYAERDNQTCPDCGAIVVDAWWRSVPRIQKKEIERITHGGYMTEDGKKVILTDKKSEAITRAQWECKQAMQEATASGDKEAAAEAAVDLEGYKREALRDIGKDKPAQTAAYSGKKIQ